MSSNYKILSIDESGKASYKHQSKLFILSAVIIADDYQTKLDSQLKKIKKKYFKIEQIKIRLIERKSRPWLSAHIPTSQKYNTIN